MTTYTGPEVHAVTGAAAGYPSKALASGTSAGGAFSFVTGEDVGLGVLVEVSFEVDDILDLTFTVSQVTGTGLGGALSNTSVVNTDTGFELHIATAAPVANTHYVFNYA